MSGKGNIIQKIFFSVILILNVITNVEPDEQVERNLDENQSHPCSRPCTESSKPLTCRYTFTLEAYHTLSKACFNCPFNQTDCLRKDCVPGNGIKRSITLVNRKLPGPAVQVCEGDKILVDIVNGVLGEVASIHWHGLHQIGTPHHDGVPMITQCPIQPGNSFTYMFTASPPGTHFYHSHSGLQRADGAYGAFVVREPRALDPHGARYDADLEEHVILVSDWLGKITRSRFTGNMHGQEGNMARSALINGLGVFEGYTKEDLKKHYTPRPEFYVEAGKRYRMRVISNAGLSCPFQFSVDNHKLSMIASDGRPFEPFEVDSFIINSGERYDFILEAKVFPIRNHWMRIRGLSLCQGNKVHQEAVLRYRGAAAEDPTEPTSYEAGDRKGVQLNPVDSGMDGDKVPVSTMTNSLPNEEDADLHWAKPEADSKYYVHYDFSKINNPHYNDPVLYPMGFKYDTQPVFTPQINYISLKFPPSPLLTQYGDIPKDLFCKHNETAPDSRCSETYCECIHLIKIPLGDVSEIFLIDRGDTFAGATHPFHLHGYSVRLAAYEKLNRNTSVADIKKMDREGKIHRNLNRTPQKDTLAVPSGGYAVLRIHAKNPGFWLLHCHIDFHLELGMGIVVQVGEKDEMPRMPRNFPKCGNWAFGTDSVDIEEVLILVTIGLVLVIIVLVIVLILKCANCDKKKRFQATTANYRYEKI